MYLSLNWLKDFVEIPKSISPEELGSRLTMHTVEIDGVEKQGDKYKNIVVGKILEVKNHPNADKLRLAKVDIKSNILEIVCGASNIEVGQLVPVALVGAIMPNGMEIKEAEIRGEKSFGMLCAEDELGLGDDHAGILILDNKAKIGQSLSDYLGLDDVVFEVDNKSITNRPDLWSHFGMAREIAAFLGSDTTKKFEKILADKIKLKKNEEKLLASVEDKKLCPRYMGILMKDIKIDISPLWMQKRLIAAGVRPINNIVDVTNYVMLELGQPMHAFDKKLVEEIVVRRAKKREEIETLDNETRKLDEETLVICDKNKPIAIAGIMGGASSEISNGTTSVILESANFNFVSVRKTSQRLGLRTESSIRFEKSLDPNLCEIALVRAANLIKEICPTAKVSSEISDNKKFSLNQGPIKIDFSWLTDFIGERLPEKKVLEILKRLGFRAEFKNDVISAIVPTWRATKDVSIKEDLVEEIARIYGYDNLKPTMPLVEMRSSLINKERDVEKKIKNILSGGPALCEVYNYSFVGEEQLQAMGMDFSNHICLANPISSQQTMLRQNLATNLLTNVKTNQARFKEMGFFEVGSVYLSLTGEIEKGVEANKNLPYQEKRLGILVANDGLENSKNNSEQSFEGSAIYEVKGIVEYLLSYLNLQTVFAPTETVPNWAEDKQAVKIKVGQRVIGFIYKLKKDVGKKIGIKKDVALAEISLKELVAIIDEQKDDKYEEFEKYPPVIRDLAFVVNGKVLYNDIKEEIASYHEYIKKVELFDVYIGEKIGKGNKNLAFHIIYQTNKTLTAEEIDVLQKELIKKLEEKFEAKIRNF